MSKKPLIILTGPTAAGKTKLSIALANVVGTIYAQNFLKKKRNGEVDDDTNDAA